MVQSSQPPIYRDRARILRISALGFFAFFLLQVATQSLPPRLLDPVWQMGLITGLQQVALYPILGILLLIIGHALNPSDKPTATLLRRCQQPARWVAVGFVLMQPVVILAMLQISLNVDRPLRARIENLVAVRSEIQRVTTLEQMNSTLAKLPGSPSLPKSFDRPLAPLRNQVRSRLSRDIDQLQSQRRQGLGQRRFSEILIYLRQLATALVLAMVYGVIGGFQRPELPRWKHLIPKLSFRTGFSAPWSRQRRPRRSSTRSGSLAKFLTLPAFGKNKKKRRDQTRRAIDPDLIDLMNDEEKSAPAESQPEPDALKPDS